MSIEDDTCQCCGARTTKLRIVLSRVHVTGLRKIQLAGGDIPFGDKQKLGMTNSEYVRSTDHHHFGLVEQTEGRGTLLTQLGRDFLAGEDLVPEWVITYRGKAVERSDNFVTVFDVIPDWTYEVISNG